MRKVCYMVLDTEMDQFDGFIGDTNRDNVESRAYDLNKSVCPLVQAEDGGMEYAEPMPERYKAVKVTIEDLE